MEGAETGAAVGLKCYSLRAVLSNGPRLHRRGPPRTATRITISLFVGSSSSCTRRFMRREPTWPKCVIKLVNINCKYCLLNN